MTKCLDTHIALSAAIARDNWECWGGSGEAEEAKRFRTQSEGYRSHWEPSRGLPLPSQRRSPCPVTTSEQVRQALLNELEQGNRRRNCLWSYVPISQILFPAKRPLNSSYHCRQKRKRKSSTPLGVTVRRLLVHGSEIRASGLLHGSLLL